MAIDDAKESDDTQIRNAKSLLGQSWANYVNAYQKVEEYLNKTGASSETATLKKRVSRI